MALIFKGTRNPNGGRSLVPYFMTSGQTLSEGEAVKLASGLLVTWGTGGAGLGVVAGFQLANGAPLTDNGAGGDFVGTYTAGASTTVQALVDVSTESLYSAVQDATLGTTTGSGLAGYNVDLTADSLGLDESSTLSTTASFYIWGVDPDGSAAANSVIVSIQESQVKL